MLHSLVPQPPATHGHLHGKYFQLGGTLRPSVTLATFLVLRVTWTRVFPSSQRIPLGNAGGTEGRGEDTQGPAPGKHPF